jgi:hypothetical protein
VAPPFSWGHISHKRFESPLSSQCHFEDNRNDQRQDPLTFAHDSMRGNAIEGISVHRQRGCGLRAGDVHVDRQAGEIARGRATGCLRECP